MENHPENDELVMSVLSKALTLEPGDRESHVRLACGGDQQLYDEVTEALEWEERMGSFLKHPLIVREEAVSRFEPGELISERFEIVREIGEGGMGIVYEALDHKRNQRIAIKFAKPPFHRLLSPELEGALRVRHPNVCLVNEIHTARIGHGEVDFLSMELLEGETLSDYLSAHEKLSLEDAVEVGRQLCKGLAEAHRCDVIHRDLKAANVILCRPAAGSIRAVITDFGLSGEAQTGELCGTPRYMAPELWLGQEASKASDIYALGIMLHEMAAGRSPAADSTAQMRMQMKDMPHFYSRLVEECLSLDPARRCRAFARALHESDRRKWAWSRRKLLTVGAACLLAVAGAVWSERSAIENQLHPLPKRRFVAIWKSPATTDTRANYVVTGLIDAIENELTRAEAFDRDFFLIPSRDVGIDGPEAARISKIRESFGANLVLEASAVSDGRRFRLLLTVVDTSSGGVLRRQELTYAASDVTSLTAKAIPVAATLLSVGWQGGRRDSRIPSTDSAVALREFEQAEEYRSQPNDDGLDAAIAKYQKAIDSDPRFASAYAKLSLAYNRFYALHHDLGALELARANAEKAIQVDHKSSDGHLALAFVFEKKGNREKALNEVTQALALDPTNPRILLWKAQIYYRFGQWAEAEQVYLKLKASRPNYWFAYQELGVLYNTQGRYQEAIQAFRAAVVLAPGSALAVNNLGGLHLQLGNAAEAERYFRRSLELKPNDLAYSNLAEALRVEGKYAEAVRFNREAVNLNPTDEQNWLGLADSYDSLRGEEKQARQAYLRAAMEAERGLRAEPADGSRWMRLALSRAKCCSGKEALALVKGAERRGASDLDSQLAKARVLEISGMRGGALAVLASCFKRGTTMFEVASIPDFAALRKDPDYLRIVKSARSNNSQPN